jgi:hypothetical protein
MSTIGIEALLCHVFHYIADALTVMWLKLIANGLICRQVLLEIPHELLISYGHIERKMIMC